jgi:hypothetical protein
MNPRTPRWRDHLDQEEPPVPLRPDPQAIRETAIASLVRAVIASARSSLDRNAPNEFEDDRGVSLVLRGPVAPLTFDGAALIGIPSLTLPHAAFVAEGQPIAVTQGTSSPGSVLEPYKLATIVNLTGEMIRGSNAEALIRQVLIENVGPSLDAAMLSAAAGVAGVRPPGILHNITALTPTAAGSSAFDAMVADLSALAEAVSPVSGNGGIVFICAPAQAMAIMLRAENMPTVFSSSTLAAKTVIAIATAALATVIDAPTIESSQDATVHMFDPAAPISDTGGLASPVANVFQTDSVSLKFRQPVAWVLRSPSAVAWMSAVNW